jgi:hypothetical protein
MYQKAVLQQLQFEEKRREQEELDRQIEEEKKMKEDQLKQRGYDPNPF